MTELRPGLLVAGIGPSMVDVAHTVQDESARLRIADLGIRASEWLPLGQAEKDELLDIIGVSSDARIMPHQLSEDRRWSLSAGSTIMGIFSAMHRSIIPSSVLCTAAPTSDGEPDVFYDFFRAEVARLGLPHVGVPVEGENPMGFVLSEDNNREKMLATFPGVANDLSGSDYIEAHHPEYVVVDSYELRGGKIAQYIDDLVASKKHKIALSLGNHTILEGGLREKIRTYLQDGLVHIVCGNEIEFEKLYPELDPTWLGVDEFYDHPIRHSVPFVMLTRGSNGITSHWNGTYAHQAAVPVPPSETVNTSGAGDTAMGSFCSGVITHAPVGLTLQRSAYLASEVLRVASSRLDAMATSSS